MWLTRSPKYMSRFIMKIWFSCWEVTKRPPLYCSCWVKTRGDLRGAEQLAWTLERGFIRSLYTPETNIGCAGERLGIKVVGAKSVWGLGRSFHLGPTLPPFIPIKSLTTGQETRGRKGRRGKKIEKRRGKKEEGLGFKSLWCPRPPPREPPRIIPMADILTHKRYQFFFLYPPPFLKNHKRGCVGVFRGNFKSN